MYQNEPWNLTSGTINYQTYQYYTLTQYPDFNIYIAGNCQSKKDGKVYLKDGQEFEIELINRNQYEISIGLELNGILEPNQLVLKRGQRVLLDRFLSTDTKLKFETYNAVDQNAVAQNGLIKIYVYAQNLNNQHQQYILPNGTWRPGEVFYSNYSNTTSFETGTIEQGSKSDQTFINSITKFNQTYSVFDQIQILPLSMKPIAAKDLIKKCQCGIKIKSKFKFCPNCGDNLIKNKTT